MISHRVQEGGKKTTHKKKAKMALSQNHFHCFIPFTNYCTASTIIPLLSKAIFTQSIQPNLGLPCASPSHTSTIKHPSSNTVLMHSLHVSKLSQYFQILSTCQLPVHSSISKYFFIPNSINL